MARRAGARCEGAERGEGVPASDRAGVWGGAPHSDDERLLEGMRRGDEAAFSELFAHHQGPIYRYAMHMCGPAAADDVVQDTFLALIRQQRPTARTCAPAQGAKRGEGVPASDRAGGGVPGARTLRAGVPVWGRAPRGFDPARGTVGAYLFGIARHHVLKRLGDMYSDADATAMPTPTGGARSALTGVDRAVADSSPLADLERSEAIALVRDAVRSLPAVYREVIVLCELQEMNYVDAAAVLECPIGTVRSRLHRGRALLTRKLASLKEDVAGVASK